MSNFLEQLDNLSNARNDTAQLYEDIENFANRYFEEIANNLLERLKKEILDSAQKGNFSYENGKRVIKGVHKINFGEISETCSLQTKSERQKLAKQLIDMNLPYSELISFAGYPNFKILGEVTSDTAKKGSFFSRILSKKMTKVCFSLPKAIEKIISLFKEKALEEKIVLSDLTYNYMYNTLNKETNKTEGVWISGCRLIFHDCISPVTYEWPSYSSKYEYAVSFGSSITGRLEINFMVAY